MEKICPVCSTKFEHNHPGVKYCSPQCSRKVTSERCRLYQKESPWYKLRFAVFRRDGFSCVYCGRGVKDGLTMQVDHVNPCLESTKGNLVTVCNECNRGKRDVLLNKGELTDLQARINARKLLTP